MSPTKRKWIGRVAAVSLPVLLVLLRWLTPYRPLDFIWPIVTRAALLLRHPTPVPRFLVPLLSLVLLVIIVVYLIRRIRRPRSPYDRYYTIDLSRLNAVARRSGLASPCRMRWKLRRPITNGLSPQAKCPKCDAELPVIPSKQGPSHTAFYCQLCEYQLDLSYPSPALFRSINLEIRRRVDRSWGRRLLESTGIRRPKRPTTKGTEE